MFSFCSPAIRNVLQLQQMFLSCSECSPAMWLGAAPLAAIGENVPDGTGVRIGQGKRAEMPKW